MSNLAAALTILAVLQIALPAAYWQIRRAWRTDQSITETPARAWDEDTQRWATTHDVGPDQLRLLVELGAHLDEYVAADAELAAGFDRLRQAIRDEQQNQKGDS